jgi:hypothetical protein
MSGKDKQRTHMDSITDLIDRILSLLLVPATLYGAGGAFVAAKRKGKPISQICFEVLGGAITANMVCPMVREYTPESLHYTLFFLVGWGGLELVGRIYEVVALALERRLARKIGGE